MASRRVVALALLIAAGSAVRIKLVADFHAPAGDGLEYHHLAHELRHGHRYAYGPEPQPLAWTRTPGYPFLLAATVERNDSASGPAELERTILWGCLLNVLLDAITIALSFFVVLESGLGPIAAWTTATLTAFCPLLWLSCCYLLRESLTTTLTTAGLLLLIRSLRRREVASFAGAAAIAGLTTLVRSDALVMFAAFVPAWWGLKASSKGDQRIRGALFALLAFTLTFGYWPIRNLVQFGEPHTIGAPWLDTWGQPLPTGERVWARTWVDDQDQGFINLRFAYRSAIAEREIHPKAIPTPADRAEVLPIIQRYNRERLSPAVDEAFRQLAWKRIGRDPLRILVWLPIERAWLFLWRFPPGFEYPLRSAFFHQPERRDVFEAMSRITCLLSFLGLFMLLFRRETRTLAITLCLVIYLRDLIIATFSPEGGFQRYLAPVYPAVLILAAVPIAFAITRLVQRRRKNTPAA